MCIRDRCRLAGAAGGDDRARHVAAAHDARGLLDEELVPADEAVDCLLYTSDAADERSRVDLGGRRIIKKKKTEADNGAAGVKEDITTLCT